jgi:nucleoredoxin
MEELFGTTLESKSGSVSTRVLSSNKYILVYFSASWCKPCSAFTPILDMFYDSVNSLDKELEIVYVSRDNTHEEYLNNYSKMPWLSVPFDRLETRLNIKEKFNAKSIPSLYLINLNGEVKKDDCVADIKDKGPLCLNEWNLALN